MRESFPPGLKDDQKKKREREHLKPISTDEMNILYKDYISSKNFMMPSNLSIDTEGP